MTGRVYICLTRGGRHGRRAHVGAPLPATYWRRWKLDEARRRGCHLQIGHEQRTLDIICFRLDRLEPHHIRWLNRGEDEAAVGALEELPALLFEAKVGTEQVLGGRRADREQDARVDVIDSQAPSTAGTP